MLLISTIFEQVLTLVAIGEALRTLGHQNVYHMTSVGPNNHHDKWVAALEAKFESKGAEFTKEDFDELLGDFDVGISSLSQVYHP